MVALNLDFFARPTLQVAHELVGCLIRYKSCLVRIVEVEAYSVDEASHGFRRTPRSALMHDTFGHIYVYRSYGVHFCLNFTTDQSMTGAILIRAAEPLEGIAQIRRRRGQIEDCSLCKGPGNLTSALGVTLALNKSPIGEKLMVYHGKAIRVAQSTRIGIRKAKDLPWRFFDPDSTSVSGSSFLNRSASLIL